MRISAVLLALLLSQFSHAQVTQDEDGLYNRQHANGLSYRVDVQSQLCFAAMNNPNAPALERIPCANLAKRKEWQAIINWLKPSEKELAATHPYDGRPHR